MRRLAIILFTTGAICALVVAALPWWWGTALRLGGTAAGLRFEDYERIGYTRWALSEMSWKGDTGQFAAKRIELPHPLALLLRGNDAGAIRVTNWRWVGAESAPETPTTSASESGWHRTFAVLGKALKSWQPRLPPVEATDGTLVFSKHETTLGRVGWEPATATLSFDAIAVGGQVVSGHVSWNFEAQNLRGQLESADGAADFTATETEVQISGEWRQQPVVASAQFDATGWLPKKATVDASAWQLPGERLGLGGRFAFVRTNAQLNWVAGRFDLKVSARSDPVEGETLPPIKVIIVAQGDLDSITIETLTANAPGLTASLSDKITWTGKKWDKLWHAPAEFEVEADLEQLTGGRSRGKMRGQVVLTRDETAGPVANAQLTAESVQWRDWPEVSGRGEATYKGGVLQMKSWRFEADDDSQIDLAGSWDFKSRTARDVEVEGRLARRWLDRWLPESVVFAVAEVKATAEGAWPELQHKGSLKVDDLTVGRIKPVDGEVAWEGVGGNEIGGEILAKAGESEISIVAQFAGEQVEVSEMKLQRADGETMKLAQPLTLTWKPAWRIEKMELRGPNSSLLTSLGEGRLNLQVSQLEKAWLADWIEVPGPDWRIENLLVDGGELEGVWQGKVESTSGVALSESRWAEVRVEATLDADGVRIAQASVSEGDQAILSMSGQLPFKVTPHAIDEKWSIDDSAPLSAEITSTDNPAFWAQFEEAFGIKIVAPVVNATVQGTWAKPEGEIDLSAERIRANPEKWGTKWPELTQLEAHLTGDAGGLKLETLTARISGQDVRAAGHLQLEQKKFKLLRDDPWAYVIQEGEGTLDIPDADLAAWATLAPRVLAPIGRMTLSLLVKPGGKLDGELRLNGAATRPIGPLGALQDITALLRFEGRRLKIESITAQTGGRPVVLKGEAAWLKDGEPQFDLTLVGENIPFVRQTGLLLRGDVDLKLETEGDGSTWLRGKVGLRDGLFLVDLQSLRPGKGGTGSAAGRPPYFSVQEMPFADWQLDVAVSGNRFLRMETPVFSGRASADFHLTGSLREPRAIGEATIDEGRVKLPFATFRVVDGWVRLRQNDPYVPHISLVGTTRRINYDLRLEINGTASTPNLQFFSSPPLASEEILLLVMAGEAPQDEVSYTASQRSTKLGAYLGQSLINQFTGHPGGEDRLLITTGDKVSRDGRETYRIEYNLDGRWSLVGEYDEFDDYNAGVKWKMFSSEKKEENDEP